jgi:hypothetical protein
MIKETPIELAHRWQGFRIRCLELAISSGAKCEEATTVAEAFSIYIMNKSKHELSAMANSEERIKKEAADDRI